MNLIDRRHPLAKLADRIDWSAFEREWSELRFASSTGRPAAPPRRFAGPLYLQHAYNLSDEAVIERWVENRYFRHFCGEKDFHHEFPIDPSSLTRWRQRIDEKGCGGSDPRSDCHPGRPPISSFRDLALHR